MKTTLFTLFFIFDLLFCFLYITNATAESDFRELDGIAAAGRNSSATRPKEDTFADIIDRALEKEFNDTDQNEASTILWLMSRLFWKLLQESRQRKIRLRRRRQCLHHIKSKIEVSCAAIGPEIDIGSGDCHCLCNLWWNCLCFCWTTRSIIGPDGFSFVSEMVQVETVAQFGVIFLLFALGLEFSATKIRVVRAMAILGGLLQILLFMCFSGITNSLCGGKPSEGVFVGAFLMGAFSRKQSPFGHPLVMLIMF